MGAGEGIEVDDIVFQKLELMKRLCPPDYAPG
jgi:hypothetical protein